MKGRFPSRGSKEFRFSGVLCARLLLWLPLFTADMFGTQGLCFLQEKEAALRPMCHGDCVCGFADAVHILLDAAINGLQRRG